MAYVSIPVESTAIASLQRDDESGDVVVVFNKGGGAGGGRYVISGMSEIEVQRWANADSPGQYFNSFVRGNY